MRARACVCVNHTKLEESIENIDNKLEGVRCWSLVFVCVVTPAGGVGELGEFVFVVVFVVVVVFVFVFVSVFVFVFTAVSSSSSSSCHIA